MPTEYTATIINDISFEQYALGCARAISMLSSMRELPLDAPLPDHIAPSAYHQAALEKARGDLAECRAWTPNQIASTLRAEFEARRATCTESNQRSDALRTKYNAMLVQVRAWTPPTPEHLPLKQFMEEQLLRSIEADCAHVQVETAPEDTAKWHAKKIAEIEDSVSWHESRHREEVQRAGTATQWLKALRESLSLNLASRLAERARLLRT